MEEVTQLQRWKRSSPDHCKGDRYTILHIWYTGRQLTSRDELSTVGIKRSRSALRNSRYCHYAYTEHSAVSPLVNTRFELMIILCEMRSSWFKKVRITIFVKNKHQNTVWKVSCVYVYARKCSLWLWHIGQWALYHLVMQMWPRTSRQCFHDLQLLHGYSLIIN